MKTYLKTLARMFRRHLTRLLSLIFMVLVSVGFISGIGSVTDKIDYSLSDYYEDRNVSDFIVKARRRTAFPEEEIEIVESFFSGASVDTGMSVDLQASDDGSKRSVRLYFLDFDNWTVNVPELVAGVRPLVRNADLRRTGGQRHRGLFRRAMPSNSISKKSF